MQALILCLFIVSVWLAGCGTQSKSNNTQSDRSKIDRPQINTPQCPSCKGEDTAGTNKSNVNPSTQPKQPEAQPSATANRQNNKKIAPPEAVILRVPVDESGNEDSTKIELRVLQQSSKLNQQSEIPTFWDNAASVSYTVSDHQPDHKEINAEASNDAELDGNSSTASWYFYPSYYGWGGWSNPWYRFPYRYWPTYGYYGNYYYYNTMPYMYYNYGYNYYYYPRPGYWW